MSSHYTVPVMSDEQGAEVAAMLQKQLSRYNDLHLTLKHVHWNVIGPNFIAVHQMIDPQVDLIRGYADEGAERIATLGGSPKGTPDAIVNDRTWPDYPRDRDCADVHLAALERVYSGVIEDTRENIRRLQDLDVVTQDILIGHAGELEKFQWFLRAHLETAGGFISRPSRGPRSYRREPAVQRRARVDFQSTEEGTGPMTHDVEKRFDRPPTFRAAARYAGVVVTMAAAVFAVYAFTARESVIAASLVPAILLVGGIGAFVKTYRLWHQQGAWPAWQGAGWFLLLLMLVSLSIPGAAMHAT